MNPPPPPPAPGLPAGRGEGAAVTASTEKATPTPPKEKVNRLEKYMATHTAHHVHTCTLSVHVCTHRVKKTGTEANWKSPDTHPSKKNQKEKKKKKAVVPREIAGKSLVAVVELILKLTFSSPFPDSSAESIWIKRV